MESAAVCSDDDSTKAPLQLPELMTATEESTSLSSAEEQPQAEVEEVAQETIKSEEVRKNHCTQLKK